MITWYRHLYTGRHTPALHGAVSREIAISELSTDHCGPALAMEAEATAVQRGADSGYYTAGLGYYWCVYTPDQSAPPLRGGDSPQPPGGA
jgi:hypothetical protein